MVQVQEVSLRSVTPAAFRAALAAEPKAKPKPIWQEVGPFLLAVIGIPVVLLILTPRRPGESAILRRRRGAR
jgi:hypothetical protein